MDHLFKIKNDPRVTRLGKFLRNRLMSFHLMSRGGHELVAASRRARLQRAGRRLAPLPVCKGSGPGIVCCGQINGRSSVSFYEWMKYDMRYIDNWSFWLDLEILAKTIPAVLHMLGAKA